MSLERIGKLGHDLGFSPFAGIGLTRGIETVKQAYVIVSTPRGGLVETNRGDGREALLSVRLIDVRSAAIFRETRNGVRPISGAKNQATAMAFGGLRSSCVRPGAHSVRRQDSRNDLTPCRMALHFVSAGAHALHSDETLGPTATRGSSHSAHRLRSLAFLCSSNDRGCARRARSLTPGN